MGNINITFDAINKEGATYITKQDQYDSSSIPTEYNIENIYSTYRLNTTAQYTGSIRIAITLDNIDDNNLKNYRILRKDNNGNIIDITILNGIYKPNLQTNTIYGLTYSLSDIFVLPLMNGGSDESGSDESGSDESGSGESGTGLGDGLCGCDGGCYAEELEYSLLGCDPCEEIESKNTINLGIIEGYGILSGWISVDPIYLFATGIMGPNGVRYFSGRGILQWNGSNNPTCPRLILDLELYCTKLDIETNNGCKNRSVFKFSNSHIECNSSIFQLASRKKDTNDSIIEISSFTINNLKCGVIGSLPLDLIIEDKESFSICVGQDCICSGNNCDDGENALQNINNGQVDEQALPVEVAEGDGVSTRDSGTSIGDIGGDVNNNGNNNGNNNNGNNNAGGNNNNNGENNGNNIIGDGGNNGSPLRNPIISNFNCAQRIRRQIVTPTRMEAEGGLVKDTRDAPPDISDCDAYWRSFDVILYNAAYDYWKNLPAELKYFIGVDGKRYPIGAHGKQTILDCWEPNPQKVIDYTSGRVCGNTCYYDYWYEPRPRIIPGGFTRGGEPCSKTGIKSDDIGDAQNINVEIIVNKQPESVNKCSNDNTDITFTVTAEVIGVDGTNLSNEVVISWWKYDPLKPGDGLYERINNLGALNPLVVISQEGNTSKLTLKSVKQNGEETNPYRQVDDELVIKARIAIRKSEIYTVSSFATSIVKDCGFKVITDVFFSQNNLRFYTITLPGPYEEISEKIIIPVNECPLPNDFNIESLKLKSDSDNIEFEALVQYTYPILLSKVELTDQGLEFTGVRPLDRTLQDFEEGKNDVVIGVTDNVTLSDSISRGGGLGTMVFIMSGKDKDTDKEHIYLDSTGLHFKFIRIFDIDPIGPGDDIVIPVISC